MNFLFESVIFALLPFSALLAQGLQQHSHYLNAEQHQNQVDLHRSLTSPSQIAATAERFLSVSYCLFPLLNSTFKITLMMLAQYVSKCIHHC